MNLLHKIAAGWHRWSTRDMGINLTPDAPDAEIEVSQTGFDQQLFANQFGENSAREQGNRPAADTRSR